MTDKDIINTLINMTLWLNRVSPLILLISGTFGQICNLLIFSKKTQRNNPTSVCFLVNAITNLMALYFGMLTRFINTISGVDLTSTNVVLCKLRAYFVYICFSLSNWLILLAIIDRYLISSNKNHRRQLSTIKNAYISIAFLIIYFFLSYAHILVLYNVDWSICYPTYRPYRLFTDIQVLIQFSLLPPILMSIFGILIIRNIRLTRQRINTAVHVRLRQRDIQLGRMLFLQVIMTIICSFPLGLSQLETTASLNVSKSLLRSAVENFLLELGRHLAYMNCSISFYLYTLAGSQFRLEIRHIINKCSIFICHQRIIGPQQIGIDARPAVAGTNRPMDT